MSNDSIPEILTDSPGAGEHQAAPEANSAGEVSWRALILGLFLTAGVAWLNCWVESLYDVHFVGGIQMPFIAVFILLVFIVALNWPLRALNARASFLRRLAPPFSSVELVTIYVMTLFGALISTPGCDNLFLAIGPGLFYFSTRENGWADLFYGHVPTWFAPGWDGKTYQQEVINRFFLGGLQFSEIPWHAWATMLIAWSIFLMLIYSLLFFTSLLFRRQWIEYEALTFPLVEVPLQMVDTDAQNSRPPARAFWGNRIMWLGFALAAFFHVFKGMNTYYPDWPVAPINLFNGVKVEFTERPWNAIPSVNINIYWGAIGLAYLLTREVSFSFWFFFLFMLFQYVFAEMLGFPVSGMEKAGIVGRPSFLIFQGVGAWTMMAGLLCWAARAHLLEIIRAAFRPKSALPELLVKEPFSPRFMVFGFLLSLIGLLGWTSFAGINIIFAAAFLGIFLITSLVLTRLVIEGGFLFPQAPYLVKEWMTTGMFGTAALGAANMTKLAFMDPMILYDTRTNTLPAFLHTMKIADTLKMDRRGLRRLLGGAVLAIIVTFVITIGTSLYALYSTGALATYSGIWGKTFFNTTAHLVKTDQHVEPMNLVWMCVGAAIIFLLITARSRIPWFPLHPLGFLAAPAYPITQLWFSLFVGWLIKTLVMKYGGNSTYTNLRPFMIGLILGNLSAMVFWMIVGFIGGTQIGYWPA